MTFGPHLCKQEGHCATSSGRANLCRSATHINTDQHNPGKSALSTIRHQMGFSGDQKKNVFLVYSIYLHFLTASLEVPCFVFLLYLRPTFYFSMLPDFRSFSLSSGTIDSDACIQLELNDTHSVPPWVSAPSWIIACLAPVISHMDSGTWSPALDNRV